MCESRSRVRRVVSAAGSRDDFRNGDSRSGSSCAMLAVRPPALQATAAWRAARRAPAGPAGRSRVAAVAQADIADVAAAVLRRVEPHVGRTYELTGPGALTLDEVAVALTRHLGREVR